ITGKTLAGNEINKLAIIQANTAFTISTRIKIMNKNNILARCPISLLASDPIDCPLLRTEMTNVPKSWTPAANTVPNTTHRTAGNRPQETAIAGPTMGAGPATDEKSYNDKANVYVGTKSAAS